MENEVAKLCVWREARNEPLEGIIGVCWVIKNRMKKQNKTAFEIVTATLQFSSMTYKSDPQLALYPILGAPLFKTICDAFDGVQAAPTTPPTIYTDDPTQGATFYRNVATSDSIWFDAAVKNGKIVKTVTIGLHTFYKEV